VAQVAMIGLGAMGSALARVLAGRGHDVTVWNRSGLHEGRGVGLRDGDAGVPPEGAGGVAVRVASTAAEAAAAAPLVLMCVVDYPAADEVLGAPGVLEALAGRTLAQLTNGGEDQVRAQMARVRAAGARMLTGGIMAYPRHIGRPETVILYSGDAPAFEDHRETLAALAGGQRFVGEDPAVQNAVYDSAFSTYFAGLMGFLENAALVASRGVQVAELAAVMPGMTALLADHLADAARRVESGAWAGDQSTVDVHIVGALRRRDMLAERGLQGLMAEGYASYCLQAHDAGDGGEDIAAIYKRIAGALAARPPAGA
jgi:3-hydroxyisobutyrate dehydrogenase-like beta-hydroxyacid dehydrogenase